MPSIDIFTEDKKHHLSMTANIHFTKEWHPNTFLQTACVHAFEEVIYRHLEEQEHSFKEALKTTHIKPANKHQMYDSTLLDFSHPNILLTLARNTFVKLVQQVQDISNVPTFTIKYVAVTKDEDDNDLTPQLVFHEEDYREQYVQPTLTKKAKKKNTNTRPKKINKDTKSKANKIKKQSTKTKLDKESKKK